MKKKFHRVVVCLGVLAASLPVVACDVKVGDKGMSFDIAQGKAADEWTRTYTLAPGGLVEIANVNGPILLSPANRPQVEVRVTREVRARSDEAAQQALAKLRIIEEVAPDRVHVESPRSLGDEFVGRVQVRTEYRVHVPAGLQISLKTENGEVRIENVAAARIAASSTNGSVRGIGVSGPIEANTINGVVQIDLEKVTGEIKATTVNGAVRLALPSGVDAELDARAVNGGVNVDESLPFTASEKARNRVSGRFGKGGPTIILSTTNGAIQVGPSRGGRSGEPVGIERELKER